MLILTHVLLVNIAFDAYGNNARLNRIGIIVIIALNVSIEIYGRSSRRLRSRLWNRSSMSAFSRWQVMVSTVFHTVRVTSWIERFRIGFGSSIRAIWAVQLSDTDYFSKIVVRLFQGDVRLFGLDRHVSTSYFISWLRINSFLLSSHSCACCSVH